MFLAPTIVRAEEVFQQFESARSNGRGGTFTAAFDSDEATRMNPATLSESKIFFQLRFEQFDGFIGENTLETISDLSSVLSDSNFRTLLEKFQERFGERQYGRGQLSFLAFRIGSFEFSPFALNSTYVELRNPAIPETELRMDTMAGANITYAFEWSKGMHVGITLRPTHRWYLANQLSITDILDFLQADGGEAEDLGQLVYGFGVGVDAGLIWQVDKTFRLGAVTRNFGDMEYFQDYDSEPPALEQEISFGLLKRWDLGDMNLDYHLDLFKPINRAGVNMLRMIRTGMELGTSYFSRDHDAGITTGLRDGYPTFGFFVDGWIARLDISNYAVEVGEAPGQRMDRRWGGTLSSSMTF